MKIIWVLVFIIFATAAYSGEPYYQTKKVEGWECILFYNGKGELVGTSCNYDCNIKK